MVFGCKDDEPDQKKKDSLQDGQEQSDDAEDDEGPSHKLNNRAFDECLHLIAMCAR